MRESDDTNYKEIYAAEIQIYIYIGYSLLPRPGRHVVGKVARVVARPVAKAVARVAARAVAS